MAGYGGDGCYEVGLTVMENVGRKLFSWCSATCSLLALGTNIVTYRVMMMIFQFNSYLFMCKLNSPRGQLQS
jgi:hypothetical protein